MRNKLIILIICLFNFIAYSSHVDLPETKAKKEQSELDKKRAAGADPEGQPEAKRRKIENDQEKTISNKEQEKQNVIESCKLDTYLFIPQSNPENEYVINKFGNIFFGALYHNYSYGIANPSYNIYQDKQYVELVINAVKKSPNGFKLITPGYLFENSNGNRIIITYYNYTPFGVIIDSQDNVINIANQDLDAHIQSFVQKSLEIQKKKDNIFIEYKNNEIAKADKEKKDVEIKIKNNEINGLDAFVFENIQAKLYVNIMKCAMENLSDEAQIQNIDINLSKSEANSPWHYLGITARSFIDKEEAKKLKDPSLLTLALQYQRSPAVIKALLDKGANPTHWSHGGLDKLLSLSAYSAEITNMLRSR